VAKQQRDDQKEERDGREKKLKQVAEMRHRDPG
jgi:hypothetical protein